MRNEHQESTYRNSRMQFGHVYFWTDTIKDWRKLLKPDKCKELITLQILKNLLVI